MNTTLRSLAALASVAIAAAGFASPTRQATQQKKPPLPTYKDTKPLPPEFRPDAPGANGWRKSSLSPANVAAATDNGIRKLHNSYARVGVAMDTNLGRGMLDGEAFILNQKTFSVEYAVFGSTEFDAFRRARLVADGTKFADLRSGENAKPIPLSAKHLLPKDVLGNWYFNASRYILAGLGSHENPLSTLVVQAQAPGSGFSVQCDDRITIYGSLKLAQHRILITRSAARAKKMGKLTIEVVTDDKYHIPVSIKSTRQLPGKKSELITWLGAWEPMNAARRKRADFRVNVAK